MNFRRVNERYNLRNLYKIVSVTDKNGKIAQDRIDSIKNICESMIGEVLYQSMLFLVIVFVYCGTITPEK